MARYKLISCSVFRREIEGAIEASENEIEAEFLEISLHLKSEDLRARLQERIEEAGGRYDAVLLGYGLCGNGLSGIRALSAPLVLPRAHDCATILLGSRASFEERFGANPSASWSSAGYVEFGSSYVHTVEEALGIDYEKLVAEYGEENARYVRDSLRPAVPETELRFIELPESAHLGYAGQARERAAAEGKAFVLIPGSSRLLRGLIAGNWSEEEYLVVPPGRAIGPSYDKETILEAE